MIQKISKGKDFAGLIQYLLAVEGSNGTVRPRVEIIGGTLDGRTGAVLAREFRAIAQARPRLKKNVLHVSLRLSKDDRALESSEFESIAATWAEGMGVEVYVAVCHGDHIHLACSRVRTDGSVVPDSHDFKRGELLVRRIETEFKLIPTQGSHLTDSAASVVHRRAPSGGALRLMQKTGHPSAALQVQSAVDSFLDTGGGDIEELQQHLLDRDIGLICNLSDEGRVRGFSYAVGSTVVSARALGHGYKLNNLLKRGLTNENGKRLKGPGSKAAADNSKFIAVAAREPNSGDRADRSKISRPDGRSEVISFRDQPGAEQALGDGIVKLSDSSSGYHRSETARIPYQYNEESSRKPDAGVAENRKSEDQTSERPRFDLVVSSLDVATGAVGSGRRHSRRSDSNKFNPQRREAVPTNCDVGVPARDKLAKEIRSNLPSRQVDRGELAITDSRATGVDKSESLERTSQTLANFFAAFPSNTQFELVVRSPNMEPKRYFGYSKELLVGETFRSLQKSIAENATCRGKPILTGTFAVSSLTEAAVADLRKTDLDILSILKVGEHRYCAWVRDPEHSKYHHYKEPSAKLRRIVRNIGEFSILQAADVPGFVAASIKPKLRAHKSKGLDQFACVQVYPQSPANLKKVSWSSSDVTADENKTEPAPEAPPAQPRP